MSKSLPEDRKSRLRKRLEGGETLDIAGLAEEWDVSVDTVRRDLKALEKQGLARCIRGGAMPVARPMAGFAARLSDVSPQQEAMARAALGLVEDGMVIAMDGGTSVLALARALPPLPGALVVTPAPAVALACLTTGIDVHLIGGRLSGAGAISVGHRTVADISDVSADIAFLGVCALDTTFGLGADDADEADVKRALVAVSHRRVMIAGPDKLGRRARHRVAPCDAVHTLVTTATADVTDPFAVAGMEVIHA
ncbi:DeoR/GlpR family DNA-binding transcription regulator [Maritimibacter sp. DP1N21-5]|uniref:DeoR/GlpR family DNA-binding transcription regulator n=1 Tax=Maritimibacter sp. DP1N21-5 TaxID=2836867 RepID=UPI001C48B6D8|nr:DeoR/GlpR family DNA-binding transcription regulator [Maritimibacter sp. DP1N21-5]MBV7409826.1 DeoR/GlpR family DNA-binding transcription regulator [Maritimibacter sp. DP1N21-5]